MAKKEKDFSKNWADIKKQFINVSQEALVLAKKGEKELVRFSKTGKLHVDAATLSVRKEQLLYLIGKEYLHLDCPGEKSPKLTKLINELKQGKKKKTLLKRTIRKIKNTNK